MLFLVKEYSVFATGNEAAASIGFVRIRGIVRESSERRAVEKLGLVKWSYRPQSKVFFV